MRDLAVDEAVVVGQHPRPVAAPPEVGGDRRREPPSAGRSGPSRRSGRQRRMGPVPQDGAAGWTRSDGRRPRWRPRPRPARSASVERTGLRYVKSMPACRPAALRCSRAARARSNGSAEAMPIASRPCASPSACTSSASSPGEVIGAGWAGRTAARYPAGRRVGVSRRASGRRAIPRPAGRPNAAQRPTDGPARHHLSAAGLSLLRRRATPSSFGLVRWPANGRVRCPISDRHGAASEPARPGPGGGVLDVRSDRAGPRRSARDRRET